LIKNVKLRVALALSALVLAVAGAASAAVVVATAAGPPPAPLCDGTTDYDECSDDSDGGTGNGALPTVTPSAEPAG